MPAYAALVLLLAGLAFFDFTVVAKRYPLTEISAYAAGKPVQSLHARLHAIDPEGKIVIRDGFGSLAGTNLDRNRFEENQLMLLKGTFEKRGQLNVTLVEYYPFRSIKYAVSMLALCFVGWRLWRGIVLTPCGLSMCAR